jgi:hypothetical protein
MAERNAMGPMEMRLAPVAARSAMVPSPAPFAFLEVASHSACRQEAVDKRDGVEAVPVEHVGADGHVHSARDPVKRLEDHVNRGPRGHPAARGMP